MDVCEEARTACPGNSFPGSTEVVLADGSRKALLTTTDILDAIEDGVPQPVNGL